MSYTACDGTGSPWASDEPEHSGIGITRLEPGLELTELFPHKIGREATITTRATPEHLARTPMNSGDVLVGRSHSWRRRAGNAPPGFALQPGPDEIEGVLASHVGQGPARRGFCGPGPATSPQPLLTARDGVAYRSGSHLGGVRGGRLRMRPRGGRGPPSPWAISANRSTPSGSSSSGPQGRRHGPTRSKRRLLPPMAAWSWLRPGTGRCSLGSGLRSGSVSHRSSPPATRPVRGRTGSSPPSWRPVPAPWLPAPPARHWHWSTSMAAPVRWRAQETWARGGHW